jgi:hypothetical protein
VILVDPDGGVTEIAVGLEVEHIDEAEEAAKEAMESI